MHVQCSLYYVEHKSPLDFLSTSSDHFPEQLSGINGEHESKDDERYEDAEDIEEEGNNVDTKTPDHRTLTLSRIMLL